MKMEASARLGTGTPAVRYLNNHFLVWIIQIQSFADVNERSVDGDDLERLGYTQYRGGNRENAYKVVDIFRGHIQDPIESSF